MPRKPRRRACSTRAGRLIERLHAVDRLLNIGRQILHTEGDPVESQVSQRVDVGGGGHARIGFQGELRASRRAEVPQSMAEQVGELRG